MIPTAVLTPMGGALYTKIPKYRDPSQRDISEVQPVISSQDREACPHYNFKNETRRGLSENRNYFMNAGGNIIDIFI